MDEDDGKEVANVNHENPDRALQVNPTIINYIIDRVDSLTVNQDSSYANQFDPQIRRECSSDLQHKLRNFYRDVTLPCVSWMDDGRDLLINDFYVDVKLDEKLATIEIIEIFSNVSGMKPTRILLEGQPGYGKTALSTKLIFDWASEKDYLREFDLAFLIPLRQLRGKSVEVAVEEISKFSGFRDYETTWKLIEKDFSKTLLIFDGLDEIPQLAREHIFQILYKQLYEEMTVVVTCRTGLFDIRRHELQELFGGISKKRLFYDKLITISGIAIEDREKFLRKFSTECDTKIILNFIGKTSSRDILNSPLFLIFLALFAVKKKALLDVTTQTEFYKTLVNCIIRASAERKKIILDDDFNIFDDSSSSSNVYANNFYEFGVLSYTKILEETLQFECNEFSKKIYDMGFLAHHKNLLFFDSSRSYEPFHLSFLEFSCAFALKRDFERISYRLNDALLDKMVKINLKCASTSLIFPFLFGLLEKKTDIMLQQMKPFSHKFFFEETTFWSIIAECQIGLPLMADFSLPVINCHEATINWTPFCESVLPKGIKQNKIISIHSVWEFISRIPLYVDIHRLHLDLPMEPDFIEEKLTHFRNIQCDQLVLSLLNYKAFPSKFNEFLLLVLSIFCLKPIKKKYLFLNPDCQELINYLPIDVLNHLKLTKLSFMIFCPSKNNFKCICTLLGNNQIKSLALSVILEDCFPNHPECSFSLILNNIAKSDYLVSLNLHVKSDVDLYLLTNGGCKNWQELTLYGSKLICSGHLKNPSCIRHLSTNSTSPETANTISKLDLKILKCSLSLFSALPVNTESLFRCENIDELSLTLDEVNENVDILNRLKLFNRLETFQVVLGTIKLSSTKYIQKTEFIVECLNLIPIKRLILFWHYLHKNDNCEFKEIMIRLKNSSILCHLISIDLIINCAVDDNILNYPQLVDVVDAISILLKYLEVNSNLKEINLIVNKNYLWKLIVRQNIIDYTIIKVDQCLLEFFEHYLNFDVFKYKFSLIQQPVFSS